MGMAQLVVTAVLVEGRSKSEVAREYGVSRRWVITLVQRFLAEGETGWRRARDAHTAARGAPPTRSRTRSSSSTRVWTETATTPVRPRSPPTWLTATGTPPGLDDLADPRRPRFVTRQPTSVHARAGSASPPNNPTSAGSSDITHWTLANGVEVEILNLIDDHSRLNLRCDVRPTFTATAVEVNRPLTAPACPEGYGLSAKAPGGACVHADHRHATWRRGFRPRIEAPETTAAPPA